MIIIDNVEPADPMRLTMDSVRWFLDRCPDLVILGNLRTWAGIDYYDPASPLFYRSESELSKLKAEAVANNWDLDLDAENLDYLYK